VATDIANDIVQLRRFNRFYTVEAGLLAAGFLKSEFSLTEGRVLYELAHRDEATAAELSRDLRIDTGYLSRILKRFVARGLVERKAATQDARKALLRLTAAGHAAYAPLDRASNEDARAKFASLDKRERTALVGAMAEIERLLQRKSAPEAGFILRPPRLGDIGWIAHRQAILYAEEHGWDASFEALGAKILAECMVHADPQRARGWIAERRGEVVGSVFVVPASRKVAKLRMLYVEPSARGLGIGRRLVDECVAFARAADYRSMTLWTQSCLGSARRIYNAAGFELTKEEKHHSFGNDLVGETWEIDLTAGLDVQNQRSFTHRPSRGRSSNAPSPSK
jgi:DNA-binding MarR family transcriptional regulator/GNAT superfamily N-acetyltransferase